MQTPLLLHPTSAPQPHGTQPPPLDRVRKRQRTRTTNTFPVANWRLLLRNLPRYVHLDFRDPKCCHRYSCSTRHFSRADWSLDLSAAPSTRASRHLTSCPCPSIHHHLACNACWHAQGGTWKVLGNTSAGDFADSSRRLSPCRPWDCILHSPIVLVFMKA
jgi:hypothetical protein